MRLEARKLLEDVRRAPELIARFGGAFPRLVTGYAVWFG